MTISRVRRQAGPEKAVWDSFRCGLALWIVLLAVLGIASLVHDDEAQPAKAIILVDAIMAAIVVVFAAIVHEEILPLFQSIGSWQTIAWTAGGFVAIVAFMAGYQFVARAIGFRYESVIDNYGGTGWPVWGILISAAVVPALFEETAFRGVIQTGMERVMAPRDALIVQAAMFSVLHLSPVVFVSHFVIGLVLGFLRRRTASVYPGMLVHGAWNAYVVLGG